MNILALDIATRTGWAEHRDGRIRSGIWKIARKRLVGTKLVNKPWGMMLTEFRANITSVVSGREYDLWVAERGFFRGPGTPLLYGYRAMAEQMAYRFGAEFALIAPKSVKLAVCGTGSASKGDVQRAVSAWLGRDVADADEADALAVLKCYFEREGV